MKDLATDVQMKVIEYMIAQDRATNPSEGFDIFLAIILAGVFGFVLGRYLR